MTPEELETAREVVHDLLPAGVGRVVAGEVQIGQRGVLLDRVQVQPAVATSSIPFVMPALPEASAT